MTAPRVRTGGCLCGSVRYRIMGALLKVAHCHCTICRRASGAAFLTWAVVAAHDFDIVSGKPAVYRSSRDSERRFCPNCGSQITFWTSRAPDTMDITVGTLDDPDDFPADRHVWASARLSWLHLDDGLPAFPKGTPADHEPG